MLMPCPITSRCFPCFESPIANLSIENEDRLTFIGQSTTSQQPPLDPPNGTTWDSLGCLSTCESTISQEDADLCAQRQQIYCNTTTWNPPGQGGPGVPIFLNVQSSCTKFCADGLPYVFTVPAGTFAALSQVLADRMAFSYACNKAALTKVCLSAMSAKGCVGTVFPTQSISLSNAVAPVTWEVTFGAMPDGLTLGGFSPNVDVTAGATETIQGTPTVGGSFTFNIKAIDSTGRFMEKQYTICISGIGPTSLPNGSTGTAYSQTFTDIGGCLSGTKTWSVSSGSLPLGLSLNSSSGLLSGTPSATGTSHFTIKETGSNGSCSKAYSMTVTLGSLDFVYIDSGTQAALNACIPGVTARFTRVGNLFQNDGNNSWFIGWSTGRWQFLALPNVTYDGPFSAAPPPVTTVLGTYNQTGACGPASFTLSSAP